MAECDCLVLRSELSVCGNRAGGEAKRPGSEKHNKVLTLRLLRILCDSSVTPGRHCHMWKQQEQCTKIVELLKPEASASIRVAQVVELDA